MEGALARVPALPEGDIRRRRPECGPAFDRKKKKRAVAAIRGRPRPAQVCGEGDLQPN